MLKFLLIGILCISFISVRSQTNFPNDTLPYYIQDLKETCNSSGLFYLPLVAADSLQNCIGIEITLQYDTDKVNPSGFISIGSVLVNPALVSYSTTINDASGLLRILLFLNPNAPDGTSFNGAGTLLSAEFATTSAFRASDTALFSVISFTESYNTRIEQKNVSPGKYISIRNNIFNGYMVYWSDNAPIAYNVQNPTQYLQTTISACKDNSLPFVLPDISGNFYYDINNGTNFSIERDILETTIVQSAINNNDVFLLRMALMDDTEDYGVSLNIYQMLAMDVNMDGKISAGDLSQINQRSVGKIKEFKQTWNYNNAGIKILNQPSRDWVFIDFTTMVNNKAFHKSSTYPGDDSIGFSKYRVPLSPSCFSVPMEVYMDCPVIYTEKYFGIMLGDVNGNFKYLPSDGKLKIKIISTP